MNIFKSLKKKKKIEEVEIVNDHEKGAATDRTSPKDTDDAGSSHTGRNLIT